MPRPETASRNQKAIYWAPLTTSTSSGRKKVSSAVVELDVRWVAGEADALDSAGNTIRLDAQVKLIQDVGINGIMWLGAEADLPSPPTDLYEIVTFDKVPNLKGKSYDRWAGLQRYSNTLPPTG